MGCSYNDSIGIDYRAFGPWAIIGHDRESFGVCDNIVLLGR